MPWNLSGMGRRLLVSRRMRGDLDRQLAGLGLHQRAFSAHDVAQVPVLEGSVQLFAHRVARDVELDAATRQGPSCTRGKAGLAHHALEHHAARHAHADGVGFQHAALPHGRARLQVGGLCAGLKSLGKATPPPWAWASRRARSFSRRSAMSWLSSWGQGSCGGVDCVRHRAGPGLVGKTFYFRFNAARRWFHRPLSARKGVYPALSDPK